MATKKTSASKTSRKAATKKRKVAAAPKPSTAKKPPAKKAPAKKATVKKSAIKKAALKKPAVKKSVVKKSSPKKSVVTKAVSKKTAIKKTAAQKPSAKKAGPKKAVVKKSVVKKAAVKAPLKRTDVQKTAIQKAPAKKLTAKRAAPRKATVQKSSVAKPLLKAPSPVLRPAARKVSAAKRGGATAKAPLKSKAIATVPSIVPARHPVSAALRAKTASAISTRTGAVRPAVVRPSSPSRRAARSAARGKAPALISASAKEAKARTKTDETLSEQKLREHIRTAVLYLEAWLRSSGADVTPAVAELAAPAEAARAQVWRWLDREARFEDERVMTAAILEEIVNQEMQLLRKDMGAEAFETGLFATAAPLFLDSTLAPNFEDFPNSAAKLLD